MIDRRKHRCTVATVIIAATAFLGQAAPNRPANEKFTISRETTLIDGPVNTDGTIHYLQAINDLLGKGIKAEENAAVLILSVAPDGKWNAQKRLAALNVPAAAPGAPHLTAFEAAYFKAKGIKPSDATADEMQKESELEEQLCTRPWKAADHPETAAWLKDNEQALRVVEEGCARPRWFSPWVPKGDSTAAWDAIPDIGVYRFVARVLTTRAMLWAGERDFNGAVADIRRARAMARFAEQEHMAAGRLASISAELYAMRAFAALAGCDWLSMDQLQATRKEIESLPHFSDADPTLPVVEKMLGLDVVMMCIRGDGERLMRGLAYELDETKPVNIGDLEKGDWDVLMRELLRLSDALYSRPARKFEDSLRDIEAEQNSPVVRDLPLTLPANGVPVSHVADVEAFLRMRDGETRQAFSQRLAYWWVLGDPGTRRTGLLINELSRMARGIALVAVSLGEYRLDHGKYPESLESMGKPVLRDSISGKNILYRKEGPGFVLWSVGANGVDDGGGPGDLSFHVGSP